LDVEAYNAIEKIKEKIPRLNIVIRIEFNCMIFGFSKVYTFCEDLDLQSMLLLTDTKVQNIDPIFLNIR
jgi:hypothetical protein